MFKFSILKTIDYEELNKNINIYREANGEDPYLFANDKTMRAMINDCSFIASDMLSALTPPYRNGLYKGYKIFPNEDLEYGEVELR